MSLDKQSRAQDGAQEGAKVYARSNFDLNKNAPSAKVFNRLEQQQSRFSPNNLETTSVQRRAMPNPDDTSNNGSLEQSEGPGVDDEPDGEADGEPSEDDDDPITSSCNGEGGAAATASRRMLGKRRKRHQQFEDFATSLQTLQRSQSVQPAAQSREQRKLNQMISLFEREEKLRLRREQKKSGQIPVPRNRGGGTAQAQDDMLSSDGGKPVVQRHQSQRNQSVTSVANSRRGVTSSRAGGRNQGAAASASKIKKTVLQPQKPAVEITVVFSDATSSAKGRPTQMSRYFYERKHHLEEKQKNNDYSSCSGLLPPDRSVILQHCLMMSQEPQAQHPSNYFLQVPGGGPLCPNQALQMHLQGAANMHHAVAGTGGPNDNSVAEDFSQTSSFSNYSKRQRVDMSGGHGIPQFYYQNPRPFICQTVPQQPQSKLLGSPHSQRSHQQPAGTRGVPPRSSVTEECASVDGGLEEGNVLLDQRSQRSANDNEIDEMQKVMELTRRLQNEARMKRMKAAEGDQQQKQQQQ